MSRLYDEIYDIVKTIPKGKVMTYGQIAALIGTGPRVVGNCLHKNTDRNLVPCHRVVSAVGELAKNYRFGGDVVQKETLESEGILIKDFKVENLDQFRFMPRNDVVLKQNRQEHF